METHRTLQGLEWLTDEVESSLTQAFDALEAFLQDNEDEAQLRFCLGYVHQVGGSLKMAQCAGGELLVDEMEQLVGALIAGKVKSVPEACEVLIQAIHKVPSYLKHITTTGSDQPALLLSLLNDLRAVRGDRLATDNILFAPDLSPLGEVPRELPPADDQALEVLTRKLRQMYQLALLGLLKQQEPDKHAANLEKVFARLREIARGTPREQLWRVAGAVVEGVFHHSIPLTLAVRLLLRELDREIRALIDRGKIALTDPFPESLFKSLLYYVAFSGAETPRIAAVRDDFKLDDALPVGVLEDAGKGMVPSFDREVVEAISVGLAKELDAVKDMVDEFMGDDRTVGSLERTLPYLKRIADTFAMTGQVRLRDETQSIIARIRGWIDAGERPGDGELESLAARIIDLETALIAWQSDYRDSAESAGLPVERRLEFNRARGALFREISNGIEQVKEAIVEYIAARMDPAFLEPVPAGIDQLVGAMRLAGLERSGEIIAACGRFVGRDIIDRRRTPDWESLDALADAITSVEYYLEGLAAVAGEEDQSVLDIAERNIAKLGYEARAANVVSLVAAAPPAQADGTVTGEENRPEQTETGDGEPETLAVDGGEEPDSGDEVDPEIKEIFIDEAREVLDTLATSVPNWLDNSQDSALIETRRAFHTLKGSGRMVGAEDIGELAWALENMLNRLIDHKIEEGPLLRRTVEDVVELLPALLADFDAGNSGVAPEMLDALVERCEGLAEGRDETEIMGESAKATGQPLQPVPEPGTLTPDQEAEQAPEQEPDQGPDVDEEALASTGAELAQAADEDVAGPEADDELLAIFSAEAETYLAVVRNFVAAQRRKSPFYDVPDNALQSALHTLKGSAYMADIGSVAEIVTPLERFLREMRNFRLPVNGEILDLLDEAVACCEASRNEAWHRGTALPDNRALQARIESVRGRVVDTAIEERVDAQLGGDPADLERVMREGMENLMAADRLFADCREGTDQCWRALADLPPELRELQKAAERADIPVLADLAGVLAGACDNLADLRTVPDEESITRLAQAHETLIAMVDAVAAHQEVEPAGGALMAALAEMASRQAEQSGPDSGRDADIVPASATGMIRQALDEEYAGAAENFEPDDTPHEAGSEESGTEAAQIDMTPETSTREEGESAAADEHVEHDPAEADRIPGAGDREEATSPPSDIGVLPEDTDPEILDIFLAEADELLEEIEQALQAWSENPSDNSWPERLKRALHTFKGGARMAGLDAMGTASHDFESLVQDSEGAPASAIPMPEMLQRYDRLLNATEQIRAAMHGTPEAAPQPVETQEPEPGPQVTPPSTDQGSPPPGGDDEGWPSARVLPFTGTPQGFEVDPVTEVPPAPEKKRMPQEMVKISAPMLDTLVNLAGETSISRSQVEQQISEFVFSLDEMQATIRRMQDQVRRLSVETDAQITFRREQIETSVGEEEFDPLEMDRYSQLQQLSRSMLESASDLQDLRDTLLDKSRDAESLLLHQSRINTDLQEGLMRTRMVPFSRLVPRLRRIVRQVAGELDKDVALKLGSVEGEIDRSVMERILPSLEHMIRNAIDHGLEDREHRLEAGKPEEGTISLSFSREGGDVLIRLSDDGRGLDVEAIRRKALEKGLIREDASLSEQEIMQFIFQPGFSTSTRVTEVSGRGVGMDVVNSEVRQLGGNIAIATRIDQGTEFSVRLPFTVSVNRALMIAVGEDTFALALDSIRGVVRLAVDELVTYYRDPDARLRYGGEDYEIRHLGTLLDPQLRPTLDTLEGKVALILVYSEGRHYALQVDDLLGSREIVVKTLGPQFSRVPGLSGATILGDGRVVVILDLQGLLRAQKTVPVIAPVVPRERDSSDPHRVRTIMVVDDSVTVRKVTGRFLGREGFEVITAKDGLDAMRVLQDNTPDLMLLDIEMPGMDGFEVARLVRSTQRLKSLPIIMITSRTGEKHRERALAMGVDRYLGKPYREDVLLHNVYDLLKAKETG